MYPALRPFLFRLDPEQVHRWTIGLLRVAGGLAPARAILRRYFAAPDSPVRCMGLTFRNPIGLAAGYDKDGLGWRGLACLGFGHIEIGTVTPRPQKGNPQPRVFRLPEDRALINRMGFPGRGAEFVAEQLSTARAARSAVLLGVNLGKNKDTPLERAAEDYVTLTRLFAPLADYLAINVSSPNTVGLRRLQGRAMLAELLAAVRTAREEQSRRTPILVKLAPDMTGDELDDALDVIQLNGMDGVIATNTTLSREGARSPLASEAGGMSGAPLRSLSTRLVAEIVRRTAGALPVIAAGGVACEEDALEKLAAGAALVQIYTGLVYEGPGLVKRVLQSAKLQKHFS